MRIKKSDALMFELRIHISKKEALMGYFFVETSSVFYSNSSKYLIRICHRVNFSFILDLKLYVHGFHVCANESKDNDTPKHCIAF